ncbi:MAG: hypothetical protein J6K58_11085 [Lachnospiraceae bacterium]|nr:hypothetical protein [Lachnospiraceae bacterium]
MKNKEKKKKSKFQYCFCIIVLLGVFICIIVGYGSYEKFLLKENNLDSWIGVYKFSESANEPDGPFMMMDYEIKIYKEEDYYADIIIDGQTTLARAKAEVYGNREWISLTFLEYLPENIIGMYAKKNDVLISFRKDNREIYTYWGEIEPMLYDNEESGKIYFQKEF